MCAVREIGHTSYLHNGLSPNKLHLSPARSRMSGSKRKRRGSKRKKGGEEEVRKTERGVPHAFRTTVITTTAV